MLNLFKKFTKSHNKSIQNVYKNFDTYLRMNFKEGKNLTTRSHCLHTENLNSNTKFVIDHDPLTANEISLNNNANDLEFTDIHNNTNSHSPSNSLPDIPCKSTPNTPSPSYNTIAHHAAVGVGMQHQLHQRVMVNLFAYRITPKYGHHSAQSTSEVPVFRNLFLPCPEEISEYERLLAGDIYALLPEQVLVRGGIAGDSALYFEQCGFYGPALSEAHYIESKIAEYPRVVLSDKIINFSNTLVKQANNDLEKRLFFSTNRIIHQFLYRDADNRYCVDFMGKAVFGYMSAIAKIHDLKDHVYKAYCHVCNEEEKFLNKDPYKLYPRYKKLRQYMDSCLSIWGLENLTRTGW